MLIYDVLHKETIYQTVVSDLRNFGVKYRFKKNAFKADRHEGAKNVSRKVFRTPLLYQPLDVVSLMSGGIVHVPVFVSQASAFLEKHVGQEGLFRKAGSQARQKELIARLDNGGTLGEKHHAIDVANCMKSFFRDLPEPLIPFMYHDLFVHCAMLKASRVQAILLACILLPPYHLNTLAFFMEFLKKVSSYESQNRMSVDNLAKVIGPNVMPLQEATMAAVQTRLELHLIIVKILIENADNIGVLPEHISQSLSVETIGSLDNDLDVSNSQLRSKSRKKKHRSGSLTRKPHLSASNLNLRMFNGLRKIVGKGGSPDDNTVPEHQQVPTNYDPLLTSNIKSTKKRKVGERAEPQSTKKKRITDKTEKSKKLRLSLDRFVPKNKQKLIDEDVESYVNTYDSCTERRWSSVSNSYDSQRKYTKYSDGLSQLKSVLKSNDESNAVLQREYNNMFLDADVNLSDDSNEQALLAKEDRINPTRCRMKLSSSLEDMKVIDDFHQVPLYAPKEKLTLNNFKAYSTHGKMTSIDDQSEEYVRVPKSKFEEIKNRVSAIESRISQEFGCSTAEDGCNLLAHSVEKVQTAYEKTLEESSIESTASTDYLAKRLGKELKIRRSGEQKIIRSPSARKIGNLRRRSQEKIMSKRVRRTASWHISHGMDVQQPTQLDKEINQAYSSNYMKDIHVQSKSDSSWEEGTSGTKLNDFCKRRSSLDLHATRASTSANNPNSTEREIIRPSKSRLTSVRRVSSFHGNEFMNTALFSDDKAEKFRKTNSQQNIILKNPCLIKASPKSDGWRETAVSWKDAEGYFKSSVQVNTPVVQTGRASIAKLRAQNAGMVLAKAKLFDECTTKTSTQSNASSKRYEWASASDQLCASTSKRQDLDKQTQELLDPSSKRNDVLNRRVTKSMKNKNAKMSNATSLSRMKMETDHIDLEMDDRGTETDYYQYVSQQSDMQGRKTCQMINDKTIYQQKENMSVKTPPFIKKVPMNLTPHDSRLSVYKTDSNALCKTPHIKKPLTVKTPKSGKALARRSIVDSRRTPLKAVGQLGTPKYQSPKSILKTRNHSRHA